MTDEQDKKVDVTKQRREPKKPTLMQKELQQAVHAFGRYAVVLRKGLTLENMLEPEFWAGVSHLFDSDPTTGGPDRSGAIIEVRNEEHSMYAELYVRAVQKNSMSVHVLRKESIGPKVVQTAKYLYRFNRVNREWDVVRKSDGEVVFSDKLKEKAAKWVEESMKD